MRAPNFSYIILIIARPLMLELHINVMNDEFGSISCIFTFT